MMADNGPFRWLPLYVLPDSLTSFHRTRSSKTRIRVTVTLISSMVVVYIVISHVFSSERHTQDQRSTENWESSRAEIAKKGRIHTLETHENHENMDIRLSNLQPPPLPVAAPYGEDRRQIPPGFVGVGGGSKVLKPPRGSSLQGPAGIARSSVEVLLHGSLHSGQPRLRVQEGDPIGDAPMQSAGAGAGAGGARAAGVLRGDYIKQSNHNLLGPPGLSNAMHPMDTGSKAVPTIPTGIGLTRKQEALLGVVAAPDNPADGAASDTKSELLRGSPKRDRSVTQGAAPRYVHLDLKVGPPRIQYLIQILPLLRRLGADGIILDYGEHFPYRGVLGKIASPSGYTLKNIQDLLQAANDNKLDVIPLVQTFSNVEFILKIPQFRYLQERTNHLQNLNPVRNETGYLVGQMLHQVLKAHPQAKFVHIGCEEVYHLGYSPESRAFLRERPQTRMPDLFLYHVTNVARLARGRRPGVGVIMWDNVLRTISVDILQRHRLGMFVEPMISLPSLDGTVSDEVISKYTQVFPHFWVSTIYNKPIPNIASIPHLQKYLVHQEKWAEKISLYLDLYYNDRKSVGRWSKLRGVALVGAYRGNHFAPVTAVLLPVALPTLGLCLRMLTRGRFDQQTIDDVMSNLRCENKQTTIGDLEYIQEDAAWQAFTKCDFPANQLYKDFVDLRGNILEMKRIINSEGQNDISPIVRTFEELLQRLPQHLMLVYNRDLAKEWLDYYLVNNLSPLGSFKTKAKKMISNDKWLKSFKAYR